MDFFKETLSVFETSDFLKILGDKDLYSLDKDERGQWRSLGSRVCGFVSTEDVGWESLSGVWWELEEPDGCRCVGVREIDTVPLRVSSG